MICGDVWEIPLTSARISRRIVSIVALFMEFGSMVESYREVVAAWIVCAAVMAILVAL
jgi:hypothetical protein